MIEVTLELRLDSFVVNTVAETGDQAAKVPHKALRFVCEKFTSLRQLTETATSADFAFLSSASQSDNKAESDRESDAELVKYISTHATVDISRVVIASGATGFTTRPKGASNLEIGRMLLSRASDQNSMAIDLVPKTDEFDAVWSLATEQKVRKVIATLVCYKLKQDNPAAGGESIAAGIVSSSLRMMPSI